MPVERCGHTRRLTIPRMEQHLCEQCGHVTEQSRPLRVYATLNQYEDGRLGEVFLVAERPGRLTRGLLEMLSIAISWGLQSGADIGALLDKYKAMRFEPAGLTGDKDYPNVSSIADYFARWALEKCGTREDA